MGFRVGAAIGAAAGHLAELAGVRKSRVGGWRIPFTVDTRGQVYKHP